MMSSNEDLTTDSCPLLSTDEEAELQDLPSLSNRTSGLDPPTSGGSEPSISVREPVQWKNKMMNAFNGWIKKEIIAIAHLSIPIMLTLVLQEALLLISLVFVGHITGNSLEVDAAGLGVSFVNVTGISVGIGLASASETLSSQAYGFKNYKRMGVILQRGILILLLVMFPIWAIWLNTESLLLFLQQTPCVARLTSVYVRIYIFALPSIFVYYLLQLYMQTQGHVWLFVLIGILSNISGVILHALFIYGAGLGLKGAAVAMVLANSITPLFTVFYIWIRKLHKQSWGGWSFESLKGWGQYIRLGAPGLLMICFEWWSAEIASFVSGIINETELAVNAIWFQLLVVLFMVPLAVSIGITIRVGNELGAGNPKGAKRASIVAIGIVLCVATVYTIFLQATKNVMGRIFTKDEEVIHKLSMLINVGCVFVYSDQIQIIISGILRGMGRQYVGAVVNFICYCLIGLPIGIPLALKAHMGAVGIWVGLAVGNVLQCIIFTVVFLFINWEKESQKAMKIASEGATSPVAQSNTAESEEGTLNSSENSCSREEIELDLLPLSPDSTTKENEADNLSIESTSSEHSAESADRPLEEMSLTSCDRSHDRSHDEEMGEARVKEGRDCSARKKQCISKLKLILFRSSFFIVGLAVLAGGVVSSRYHPPVQEWKYANCTSDMQVNGSYYVYSNVHPTPTPSPVWKDTISSALLHTPTATVLL